MAGVNPGTYDAPCGCPLTLERLGRPGTAETWLAIIDHDVACPDRLYRVGT